MPDQLNMWNILQLIAHNMLRMFVIPVARSNNIFYYIATGWQHPWWNMWVTAMFPIASSYLITQIKIKEEQDLLTETTPCSMMSESLTTE